MKRYLVAVTASLSLGCAFFLLGKPYERTHVPQGMSVIYFYASDDIRTLQDVYIDEESHNNAVDYSVRMMKGGYFPSMHPAGTLRLITHAEGDDYECVTVEVESGFQYWVRVAEPSEDRRGLEVVAPEDGESEIAAHRKLGAESRSKVAMRYAGDCPMNGAFGTP